MVRNLKVEFLIPLKYNDGTDVEPIKLFNVKKKVVKLFGGITIHPLTTEGIWIDPKTNIKYYDKCRRFETVVKASPDNLRNSKRAQRGFEKDFQTRRNLYALY